MKWIRYSCGNTTSYGILTGTTIQPVVGDPFHGYEVTSKQVELKDVTLEVPLIPRTFYAAGMNYAQHVKEVALRHGIDATLPTQADIGYRANNALIAHDEDVIIPADAGEKIHYEGELVVVVGRKVKNVTEADALDCVLGYTIGNDVSERDWQKLDRTFWRSKNSDTFKPMGPWIETEFDITGARTEIRLNGQVSYAFDTAAMIFGVAHFISRMSQYITLYPGDVIWMGTDGSSPNIRHGDTVEVGISGIGTLRNRFVRAGA
ncbi:fumarylacetoacetate hydrolase family protein [Ottowia thiooxydans]|uniref:fumarylacetoacetate hydrolase family protein n=1 Tax=Ottowia thiooxydans TaxID=219182 RepID=UPI00048D99D5|nr:fumarylacetoacetate hydrolase family protein [Ottowia thiooxydans]